MIYIRYSSQISTIFTSKYFGLVYIYTLEIRTLEELTLKCFKLYKCEDFEYSQDGKPLLVYNLYELSQLYYYNLRKQLHGFCSTIIFCIDYLRLIVCESLHIEMIKNVNCDWAFSKIFEINLLVRKKSGFSRNKILNS